jgi:hypothetical protein
MLAGVEELLDYDLQPRTEVLEEVRDSSNCALCGAEPLSISASYAETLAWLEQRDPSAADEMRRMTDGEVEDIERSLGGGRSRGDVDAPTRWFDTRKTYAIDSKIFPGYAVSIDALGVAMSRMAPERQEFFTNTFLAAICDVCATRATTRNDERDLLLLSYINQWAGGSAAVARAQPAWGLVETTARIVDAASAAFQRSA